MVKMVVFTVALTALGLDEVRARAFRREPGARGLYPKSKPPFLRVVLIMAGNALYDVGMRLRAAELHDEGHGRAAIAALLGMPEETVREWLCTYRSAGIEVLAMMGKKHTAYSFETKLAAVRAVVDEGMTKPEAMEKFGIASPSPFKKWLKAYREEGPEALRPKPRGRPRGSGSPSGETTREQELERRIKRLEAENAYLKKSIALKAEKRSRTARRPRS